MERTEDLHQASKGGREASRGETILVVDDEPTVLNVARAILTRAGYPVMTADCGQSACHTLATSGEQISLIVLDATMPTMTGMEAFRQIRNLGFGMPVILSSGFNEERFEQDLSTGRFISFLHKPYTPRELEEAVRAALAAVE